VDKNNFVFISASSRCGLYLKNGKFRKLVVLPSSGKNTVLGTISVATIYYRTTVTLTGVYKAKILNICGENTKGSEI
jgi:hypothetical protein